MAKVLLLSAAPDDRKVGKYNLEQLVGSAKRANDSAHTLVSDAGVADLIIFVEREGAAGGRLEGVRKHTYYRTYRDKCFVFDSRYKGIPYVPGVYASLRQAHHNTQRTRSGHYLEVREDGVLSYDGPIRDAKYLFSFVGTAWTHKVRQDLLSLKHSRALLVDTAAKGILIRRIESLGDKEVDYMASYGESLKDSKFVLCPRGKGPSTMRLFETMMLGRVPVIISDAWVSPEGPDWAACSLRVAEKDVRHIPELCEEYEFEAVAMGEAAREAWKVWFSHEVSFTQVVEWCLAIQRSRTWSTRVLDGMVYTYFLQPATYDGALLSLRHIAKAAQRALKQRLPL